MKVVAIVNDERNILTWLRMAFEAEGDRVETYLDPLVALPKLICVPPTLLILNGRMPGLHGIDFFLKFREFSSTPVIFLSASATGIALHLDRLGIRAAAYVEGAFSQRQMLQLAKDVVRAHRAAP